MLVGRDSIQPRQQRTLLRKRLASFVTGLVAIQMDLEIDHSRVQKKSISMAKHLRLTIPQARPDEVQIRRGHYERKDGKMDGLLPGFS